MGSSASIPLPNSQPFLGQVVQRYPIPCIWAGWALFLLLLAKASFAHFETQDDDYLRLMQVRDLLAGQGWFDVHQYRMNPPLGAEMHWSRLVDVPIALALALARLALPEPAASMTAMTVVPLAQLLLVMGLMARLMHALGAPRVAGLVAAALVPLSPLVLNAFTPLRIDHHGWQGIAALGCGLLLIRPGLRNALAGGVIAGLWLSISLEGLPLVASLAAIYGLRFAFWRDAALVSFMAGLAGTSVLAHLATRPLGELAALHPDAVGWPHMAGFALAAVLCGGLMRLGGSPVARLAALALIGLAVAAVIIGPLGIEAVAPFAALDPVMKQYWYDAIKEGLPITHQLVSTCAVLIWPALIVGYAFTAGIASVGDRKLLLLGGYALAATLISFLVMRGGINAELLSVPFSALIVVRLYPRVAAMRGAPVRALATVLLLTLATPSLASAAFKAFDGAGFVEHEERLGRVLGTSGDCELTALNRLPQAHIFATTDLGPKALVFSPHTVVTGGYHRNMTKMREVTEAFSGDPARAEGLVRANHADLVMLCLGAGDTDVYRSRRPDNLANRLVDGHPPAWLEPVPGFDGGALKVWRVRGQALNQPGRKVIAAPFMQ